MAYADVENKECLCDWLAAVGDFKLTLEALLAGATSVLQAAKAAYLLLPTDLSDEWDKLQLQAELVYVEAKLDVIAAPLVAISGYLQPWADCDPVATFARDLKDFKDSTFSDIVDRRYEIEQLLSALDDRNNKTKKIDMWIDTLTMINDAIEYCGEV